jgi:hypothetical protein
MYMKNVYKNLTSKTNMRLNNKTKQKPHFQNTLTVRILEQQQFRNT